MSEETIEWKSIALLGRQPALGIAELESLFGADNIKPFGTEACLITASPDEIPFSRLGGSIKLTRLLTPLPSTNWSEIERFLLTSTPEHAGYVEGKLTFGISAYGLKVNPKAVAKTALLIKKAIRATGKSVRMVPHKDVALGSAVVLHNQLTKNGNWELTIISDGKTAFLAQTTHVQDIDAYAARDQARPHRDAKVGMLPPKLAQVIINLSTAVSETHKAQADLRRSTLVLDPFCGTGVLLQEAMLMDYDIYGTDIEPRMIQYTIDNLTWLDKQYPEVGDYRRVEIGDATTHTWQFPEKSKPQVAGETYLGKPLHTLPPSDQLSKIIFEANQINHRFLQNISSQLPSGTRLCLAVPAWRGKHEFLHLPLLDHLTDMGYTRMSFKHVSNADLIYHRENQVVARELLVLIKN